MSADYNGETATPLVERVNDAIRDNPLAAGLIGAGLAWMIFGTKGFSAIGGMTKAAGVAAASGTQRAGHMVADAANATMSAGSNLVNAGSNLVSAGATTIKNSSADVMGGVASLVPDISVGDSTRRVVDAGGEYGAALKSRLSDSLEQQPLLIGAIGLAIGAGIASTFASTAIESEWMGAKGAEVRKKFEGLVDDVKDRGADVLSDVKDQAAREGLTADGASQVVSKVGNVASAARDAVVKNLEGATSQGTAGSAPQGQVGKGVRQ